MSRLGTVNDTAFLLSVPSKSSLTPVLVVKASGVVCCMDYKEEQCVVDDEIRCELVIKVHGACIYQRGTNETLNTCKEIATRLDQIEVLLQPCFNESFDIR